MPQSEIATAGSSVKASSILNIQDILRKNLKRCLESEINPTAPPQPDVYAQSPRLVNSCSPTIGSSRKFSEAAFTLPNFQIARDPAGAVPQRVRFGTGRTLFTAAFCAFRNIFG